jgi:L-threonylcarbamoyladenylate synthase
MALAAIADLVLAATSGQVISFATDTVPALAVKPEFAQQIYQVKQRDRAKPLILMAATWQELSAYLDLDSYSGAVETWQTVAQKYLPGALTLVLPANCLGRSLNFDIYNLGVRIPNQPLALEILEKTGALLTTSANLSGADPIRQLGQIAQAFPQVVVANMPDPDLESGSGLPSTVVTWTKTGWQVLRQGAISFNH